MIYGFLIIWFVCLRIYDDMFLWVMIAWFDEVLFTYFDFMNLWLYDLWFMIYVLFYNFMNCDTSSTYELCVMIYDFLILWLMINAVMYPWFYDSIIYDLWFYDVWYIIIDCMIIWFYDVWFVNYIFFTILWFVTRVRLIIYELWFMVLWLYDLWFTMLWFYDLLFIILWFYGVWLLVVRSHDFMIYDLWFMNHA